MLVILPCQSVGKKMMTSGQSDTAGQQSVLFPMPQQTMAALIGNSSLDPPHPPTLAKAK